MEKIDYKTLKNKDISNLFLELEKDNISDIIDFLISKNKTIIDFDKIEKFFWFNFAYISNFWIKFFKENLWINIEQPKLVFYEWEIEVEESIPWTKLTNIANKINNFILYNEWTEKIKINNNILYDEWKETIYINKNKIWNLFENEISFSLILAHEMSHVIAHQLRYNISEKDSEYLADFIAWFTLKYFENEWLTDKKDLEKSLEDFEKIWILNEISSKYLNKENIYWDRKKSLLDWFNSDKETIIKLIKKLLPSLKNRIWKTKLNK